MTLRLHNTATRNVETFVPTVDGQVSLYTCGPTVYDFQHIGNWAAYIYWDILVRTLLANGLSVHRVLNITDVGHLVSDNDEGEDKLEKGAKRENKTAWQVAEYYSEDFLSGMGKLGLLMPEQIARATDFIAEQLELVRTLKEKGFTYQIRDGIYFDTSKFPRYDDFARLNLDELKAGARIEVNPEKRNPWDFALWKFTPQGITRDMHWETPIDLLDTTKQGTSRGMMGFPGWHLECSAIAMNLLGETLDIHTGGIDHIPVHHTNEIAQSEAATGKKFVDYWLHNSHLKVEGTKISKSLGNGYTLQDLEKHGFQPMDYRLFALQSHYQSEGNFTFEALEAAKSRRKHWRAIAVLRWQIPAPAHDSTNASELNLASAAQSILEALDDNLSTPEAFKIVDELFANIEKASLSTVPAKEFERTLQTIDELLGLQLMATTPDIDDDIKNLISDRTKARNNHDWVTSDKLRFQLSDKGIAVRDTDNGTVWSYEL